MLVCQQMKDYLDVNEKSFKDPERVMHGQVIHRHIMHVSSCTVEHPSKSTLEVKRRKLQWHGHVSHSSGLAKTILHGTGKGGKKTRETKEEARRQHQGMDKPGVRQVPEGCGEQRKMEETGCETTTKKRV